MKTDLKQLFKSIYHYHGSGGYTSLPPSSSDEKISIYRAPARINIIGEHTDYNNGYVLPICIDRYIWLLITKRKDKVVNLYSTNFPENFISFNMENITVENNWADLPKGVIKVLLESGFKLQGMNILYHSEIPIGSGLSSSAAVEVVTGYAIADMFSQRIERKKLALVAQQAEHEFLGVKCGIMDQFVISHGKENNAILLDCLDLNYNYIPLDMKEYTFVVCNSNVSRKLSSSEYNLRRAQCEEGVKILRKYIKNKTINSLRDVTIEEFNRHKDKLPAVVRMRVEHVICENQRVLDTVESIRRKNFARVGKYLTESHNSLRNLYEVSSRELDTLVEAAMKISNCLGARLTGAGFGGCVIALIRKDIYEEFKNVVTENYYKATKIYPEVFPIAVVNGVERIENDNSQIK